MYPKLFSTPGLANFAEAVDQERQRQLAKFGEQRHRDGTSAANASWADHARARCQEAADAEAQTWGAILYEEFAEAMAETDPAQLRAELVQIAAVCAAWISDLDTRVRPAPAATRAPVAYQSRGGRLLRCLRHAPGRSVLDSGDMVPVTSDDLPDGGICTYPDCGVDVLTAALDDRIAAAVAQAIPAADPQ
ncbi:hypothetical protein ACIP9H_40335 [Streptomyces sp. NPDC088732]|uniref:hypothetical protein n=1 Tax=Streptomyces sp. NPDC088732 TaxID=3365879 RepID=UPI00382DE19A